MKQQQLKFLYGSKGIVFTLDMLVAFLVFAIAFIVSIYYVSQASEDKLANVQISVIASDTVSSLDNSKILDTLNSTLIQNEIDKLIPKAYQMRLVIEMNDNSTIEVGEITPEGIAVAAGKRFFVAGNKYGEVNYWIWPRQ